MNFLEIILIAIGLAMDAFAVSVANGVILKEINKRNILMFGIYFGTFQFAMPLIGWLIGMTFADYLVTIDHWVAFVLLSYIGGNMIIESFKREDKNYIVKTDKEILRWQNMTILAIATSIDAMAVGVSLAVVSSGNILFSSIVIGIVAFILSSIGVLLGKKLGNIFKKSAEIIGGSILIMIGIKTLLEHIL